MIGGLDDAIMVAKQLANIQEETTIQLIYYPKSQSYFNQLFSRISFISETLINPIEKLEKSLLEIQMKPLALMPFSIQ